MSGIICFTASLLLLALSVLASAVLAKARVKRKGGLRPFQLLFGGVFLSSALLFVPIYMDIFANESARLVKTVLLSVYNAICLFIINGDFAFITENLAYLSSGVFSAYSLYAAILFIFAPLLTFGAVLLFFKNISAYKDYFFGFFKDAYIFSELNEKSLALAEDLKNGDKKRMVVFANAYTNAEESSSELTEKAAQIGAICFKRGIAALRLDCHSAKKKLSFFVIGENDTENLQQAMELIGHFKERADTTVYVFSTSVNGELLLNKLDKGRVKVRRINEVQSLVSRTLYDEGYDILFGEAKNKAAGEISAVVLGMGKHGTEMVKALPWFCQMDGYRASIHVFDIREDAESEFSALCPELMDEAHNGDFETDGEAHYAIHFHSGVSVNSKEFLEQLGAISPVTYIFVALGNDEENIKTAVRVRSFLEKKGMHPVIQSVVYSSDVKKALDGITNYSNQKYDIRFIGDLKSSYSEKVILNSDVEQEALARHAHYCGGDEEKIEEFWQYEYNYRSSVASAIHKRMKIKCGIGGADKPAAERTEQELWAMRNLEHRRWNAYMRSEGYTYGEVRNNLAKTHHCLVPFDKLSLEEQKKDDD